MRRTDGGGPGGLCPALARKRLGCGALVIPAFVAMWFIRVPSDEAMMRAEFGTAYDDYCRRAGRLLPR